LDSCKILGCVCWKSCPRISGFVTMTTIEYMWLYKIQFLQEKTLHQLPRQNYILLMVQKIWVYLVGDVLSSQLTCLCWHQVMRMKYTVWRMWFRLWDQLEDKLFLSTPLLKLLDEEKIGGKTVVSLLKFLGSMVL